jgi:starch-binding outer membrane protein, SusD/RagB family
MKCKKILFILAVIFLSAGCEDVLDKEPLDVISDASLWRDAQLIESFLADLYLRTDINETLQNDYQNSGTFSMIACMAGSVRQYGAKANGIYKDSTAPLTSVGPPDRLAGWKYNVIREINIFIEKMQSECPLEDDYITMRVSEARFLRAWIYFELVKRYGGVPLVTRAMGLDDSSEEIMLPRSSEQEVYDYVLGELTELATSLPGQHDGSYEKGRPTKWAAMAFKSRVALFAASIARYGTVQTISAPLGNLVLGIPASDEDTYAQMSYDAAKAVIEQSGHELYREYDDPMLNFQSFFLDETDANKEKILCVNYDYAKGVAHRYTQRAMPHDFNNTWAVFYFHYDWIELFEFADGTPGDKISRDDLDYATSGNEWSVDELFHNRDPRFKATVFYQESDWQGGKVHFHDNTIRDGEVLTSGEDEDGFPYRATDRNRVRTGFMIRKRCNPSMIRPVNDATDETDFIVLRLGEVYLNLAEAAFYLDKTGEALDALNEIRDRAGMPPKAEINEEILQNERHVELTFEFQCYWDLRRWRKAQEWLDGKRLKGFKYTYNYDTDKYRISVVNSQGVTRLFLDHYYYLPIGIDKITDNPNMVENPGY